MDNVLLLKAPHPKFATLVTKYYLANLAHLGKQAQEFVGIYAPSRSTRIHINVGEKTIITASLEVGDD